MKTKNSSEFTLQRAETASEARRKSHLKVELRTKSKQIQESVRFIFDWNQILVNIRQYMRNAVSTLEVREAILDATDVFLSQNGYKKMTIDDLAAAVGIGKGSVYLHFTSKEEIVLSHIDRIIERLKDELTKIAAQNISAEERLKKMLVMRVLFRFDSVQHYTQSLNDLLTAVRPKLLLRRENYFAEEARIFAAVIKDGEKSEVFETNDALKTAENLLLATNSLLPFSLTAQELGERGEIEEKVRQVANLLLKGLICRNK